ncbi:MAG TPA: NUDIX hydrolase [Streptosporangiaceae bacterium]|nr:NUDIX hydrolase [Streptosporangiaceae bacterium]
MADALADGEIRAAGAVLWRPAEGGVQVALVHRPKYDDWTFPKGKRDPGEHILLTAVREVAEETGLSAILGRPLPTARYQIDGRPKRVDYWAGRPEPDGQPAFQANNEVDALDWLRVPAARDRLSYAHDTALLDEFAAGPADTLPLVFLRHASAGGKGSWPGNDLDRPLDARGAADAERLARMLACFGSCRVITSAAERCVATVRPYAALTGMAVALEPAFTIGLAGEVPGGAPEDLAAAAVAAVVAAGVPAVICAHGENLPPLVAAACAVLGAVPPFGLALPKAGFWVLHAADGRLAGVERHYLSER